MAVNLRDVARLAGVSVPTASRVLSGSDYPVLPALRERVEEAARELDYVPNAQAQGLLRGSAGTIGVLAGDIGDPYFSEIVNGIHSVATERQILVTICHTERDPVRELDYFRMLQSHRTSVVILAGSGLDDEAYREGLAARARSFSANGGRVVAIGSPVVDVDRVLVDNAAGGRALAEHLLELGHRDIGVVSGPQNVGSSRERVAGLREVVEAAGGRVHVRHGAPTREAARAGAHELLTAHPGLTAIVGSADQLAIGAMNYLRDQGRDVPGDVSVAGFNDIDVASDVQPALTTVHLPLREMGEAALRIALEPAPDTGPVIRRLGVELVVRDSTGPALAA